MIEEMFTPEGIAQMFAEEQIENVVAAVPKSLAFAYAQLKLRDKLLTQVVKKAIAKRSATVAVQGMAPAVSRGMIATAVKNLSNHATRQAVKAGVVKMGKVLSNWKTGVLFFALQAVGQVLDVDDAAGFSAQLPQDGVDLYMKKMLKAINEIDELKGAGVQFPREYLPQNTITYRAKLYGEVAEDRKTDLMLDYIDRLDVNSNGKTIIRDWTPSAVPREEGEEPEPSKSVLWNLSGKDEKAYATLSKWWWVILISFIVVVLSLGLGIGLSARKRRNNNKV
jgi:hypothetical protein